jgi:IS4 transposase
MTQYRSFSLSLQKEMERRKLSMDSEIDQAMREVKMKSMLHHSGIMKKRGYATFSLLYLVILLPFIQKYFTFLWSGTSFLRYFEAHKDTFYRFLNNERFNWRAFVYLLATRLMALLDDVPLRQKVLIADDTIIHKTGRNMELVSYHFDHTTKKSLLGYQCLQLGYHNGASFFPIDVAFHCSRSRPNQKIRAIDKRTNGWRRRTESFKKKTELLIDMVRRAWSQGIDACLVIFDTWFAHDAIIAQILAIGYGVICRLKRGKVKYIYQGRPYTLKQLWHHVARERTRWLSEFRLKGVCLKVSLPQAGDVLLLFVSEGKKQWHAFLSTDVELEPSEILTYYARRWAIEIFFKDSKQMLYLGKEQSETFDAAIACYSLVMLRYLLLVYILKKHQITGPIGPLFRDLVETHLQLYLAEEVWAYIRELMIMSSQLFWPEMEPDKFLHLIEIVEDAMSSQLQKLTAKL